MKKQFIQSIYEQNNSQEGLEKLYYELQDIENHIWQDIEEKNISNWIEVFEQKAIEFKDNIIITEAKTKVSFTYEQLNDDANKIKAYIEEKFDQKQIGINFENSYLFMVALIGINKANRIAILFNNREPDARRIELSQSTNTEVVLGNSIEGCRCFDIQNILDQDICTKKNYTSFVTTLEEPAFVIFTSGTTGKSKGALFSHRRMLGAGIAWSLRTAMNNDDNCYIPLPLYHGNALAVAFSAVVFSGAKATFKVKFSVSDFWNDIDHFKCTHMVYIGELWRYILNKYPNNLTSNLKVIFGNGLTKELWDQVVPKYNIAHVVEHFGSTEMPAGALTNWFNKAGFCGYLPPEDQRNHEMVLVDEDFNVVEYGHSGEALFLVPSGKYRGYLDSTEDSKKLHHSLFKKDDLWWKSGDLLKSNKEGFFTFVERLGDTYRFKGENVACVDVEDAIRETLKSFNISCEEVVVYGIKLKNIDGKIGMSSLVLDEDFNPNTILEQLRNRLANYAMPYFIKIEQEKHETTSTLKIQKNKLAKKALDEYKKKKHYILHENCYEVLDDIIFENLDNGTISL